MSLFNIFDLKYALNGYNITLPYNSIFSIYLRENSEIIKLDNPRLQI